MSGIFQDAARLRDGDQVSGGEETVPLTVSEPDGHTRGGIVVLHETRTFSEAMLDLMRALAAEGWLAVAPDLFHREPEGGSGEVFGDNLFADFDACFDWLVGRGVFGDCVGALGFDDAGTAAFLVATNRPIGAAVSVAARGIVEGLHRDAPALVEAAPRLQAPWLGLYGEDDPETPTEHLDRLRDALARADVAANVVSYAGLGHRADQRQRDEDEFASGVEALMDAQTRIFDWFDSNLR